MKALEDVVFFKIDAEKGEGIELWKEYQGQGFPTYVLANSAGETMEEWNGYGGVDHFLGLYEPALADPTTIEQKQARFHAEPKAGDAEKLARYHGTRGEYTEAIALYERAGELDPSTDYAFVILESTHSAWHDEKMDADAVKAAADAVLANRDAQTDEYLVYTALMMGDIARKLENMQVMAPYLEAALAATEGTEDEDLQRRHTQLKIEQCLHILGDADQAVELKLASQPEGWKEDPGKLNGFAWWCFENEVYLDEAEALARRGAKLAAPGAERAMVLDTVAEICNARGNCDDAVELIQQALVDSPDSEYYQKQLKRFEEIRAEQAN